jgi:Flp pilus assembly protein TadG
MRNLIFGLARPMMRLLGRDESGAIGVLVAVLIGGGVLLGMGALTIDVGRLYQNQAELQNGADAAALAVAKSCASGTCNSGLAAGYANANASNLTAGKATVDLVCGTGSLGAGCVSPLLACPANPAAGTNYVDVRTSTGTPSGLLPPVFARTLVGNSGYSGTNVKACAQAEWGPPKTASTIAFTISACEWDKATNQGATFAPPPPYPPNTPPAPSFDQVLKLHTTSSGTGCPTEPAGADAPGNFGWTDDSGNCSVTISNSSYGGNTGTSASQDCQTALQNDQANRTLIFIPVYTKVTGNGTKATFSLKGFAAFVITGYHITGSFKASDWLNPKNDCKGSDFCINGYFTQGLVPSSGSVGGPNLGASIIVLSG